MYFLLFVGVLCLSLFCYALLYVHSSFANILKRKRKLVALLLLSYRCIVTVNVLWLFLAVPLAGIQYVIVVFAAHTHLLFDTFRVVASTKFSIGTRLICQHRRLLEIIFRCLVHMYWYFSIARPLSLYYNHCVSLSVRPSITS